MSQVKDYIQIFENILPEKTHSKFIRTLDFFNYSQAALVGDSGEGICDTSVRDVQEHGLSNKMSATSNHWYNLFSASLEQCLKAYRTKYKFGLPDCVKIESMSLLKYQIGGKYEIHVDDGPFISRTFSSIYFVNDDYVGGELEFVDHMTNEVYLTIKPKKNSLVLWPSNFLYPHGVRPVKEGTRYTIVAWIR